MKVRPAHQTRPHRARRLPIAGSETLITHHTGTKLRQGLGDIPISAADVFTPSSECISTISSKSRFVAVRTAANQLHNVSIIQPTSRHIQPTAQHSRISPQGSNPNSEPTASLTSLTPLTPLTSSLISSPFRRARPPFSRPCVAKVPSRFRRLETHNASNKDAILTDGQIYKTTIQNHEDYMPSINKIDLKAVRKIQLPAARKFKNILHAEGGKKYTRQLAR
jgi:hypothetical protein